MTLDEARKVAAVISTADRVCGPCVEVMKNELATAFPEFIWKFENDVGGLYEPTILVEEGVYPENGHRRVRFSRVVER